MFPKKLIVASCLLALPFSLESWAKGQPDLKGCYDVERSKIEVAAASKGNVVGTYSLILSSQMGGRSVHLFGPIAGSEGGAGEGGGHLLGLFSRDGVMVTQGDSVMPTSVDCPDENGNPRFIQGIETLNFSRGTGVFLGLESGQITYDVVFDGCTDPTAPKGDLALISGELCFEE